MSAMRQREVLSPLVTTPNIPQRHQSQSSNASPALKVTSVSSPSTLLMEQQNDELEKKARRRSRVMDLQRKNIGSPSSPSERRKSIPLQGFSTAQLTEHYTSCIKLSAENKINAKNAFGLHLIDYMSELLKKKELENFQVASTTLDASAKIYAGRVDAIHAETYKVLSGLGRGADKQKQAQDDDGDGGEVLEGDEDQQKTQGKAAKKKKRKSKTVETNLKNINVNKFDLEFEVDPLFKVMSAAFDEGGSSGLLLSNLRTFDNTQRLVLDSNTLISPENDLDTSRIEERKEIVDVSNHKNLFSSTTSTDLKVCPAFSSYRFTNWDSTTQDSTVAGVTMSQEEHRFDMDAEPEPIHDDNNMSMYGGGDGSFMGDDVEDVADTNLDDMGADNCIGDGKAAQLVQSVLNDMTHGTTGALMQVLSTEPSDYSYFNKALLRTWAGPSHWRAGNLNRDWKASVTASKAQKPKEKRQVFRIDYDQEIDFGSICKHSNYTSLTRNTLSKYSRDQTTLPKDHHYDADKLFRLFLLKRTLLKRQKASANVDDEIENYDYENVNDRENFCPNDDVDDDDIENEVDFGTFVAGGTDEVSSSQDPFSQSQDVFTQGPLTGDGTILTGDNLVAQPYKVAKIDIDYAKTAKKLDVKRLKSSMWNLLKSAPKEQSPPTTEGDSAEPGTSDEPEQSTSSDNDPNKEMKGQLSFQNLLTDLPARVSGQTARNLSVPIAFVCLLHLANEKTLKIEEKNMADLIITQGL